MTVGIPTHGGLAFGGDYNPEQWPEDTWSTDVQLMKTAGVTLVTVGVFSWAMLEPEPGRYDFGWLDRVMDLLHSGGIGVDLATATASPPPWFSAAHPLSLPVGQDGRRLSYGSRQAYCPSSPEYRAASTRLVQELATRYADHPALRMWHVNNEYGCHVDRCWCDVSAEAFRAWLRRRYPSLDALNAAWGTTFWSQRYSAWSEILPTLPTPSFVNPTQQLDFYRFSSDELLACYRAEREVLRRITPDTPVTTNIMAGMNWSVDYWSWATEMDLIATDHYPMAEHPHGVDDQIAFAADLTRLARGADALLYFQWRASAAGAEKWHSGMLPHAGTDSKVFREVTALGAELAGLSEIAGSTVVAEAAILLDWSSLWAQQHPALPSVDMAPLALIENWHAALRAAGITCDFARPDADLSAYRLVVVPALYLVSDAGAANVASWVASGGTLVVAPFSGIVDDTDHVRLGGYPGAWRDLLGVRVEEHFPLAAGATVTVDDGTTGHLWTELSEAPAAEVLTRYADGPLAGSPARTRNHHGDGVAHYLTTTPALTALLGRIAAQAGVLPAIPTPVPGVDATLRRAADGVSWTFLANNRTTPVDFELTGQIVTGAERTESGQRVPAGGFAILRSP